MLCVCCVCYVCVVCVVCVVSSVCCVCLFLEFVKGQRLLGHYEEHHRRSYLFLSVAVISHNALSRYTDLILLVLCVCLCLIYICLSNSVCMALPCIVKMYPECLFVKSRWWR